MTVHMYSIIDLITQNGWSPSGDRIFQSGRQWVNLVAYGEPQVATLSTAPHGLQKFSK